MVRHTNHDKEFIKRKKKKKQKCTLLFFACFRKFDQAARTRLGAAMYILARGHQAVKMAGPLMALCRVVRPRALLVEAAVTQASVPWKRPQLCPRGCPPFPWSPPALSP